MEKNGKEVGHDPGCPVQFMEDFQELVARVRKVPIGCLIDLFTGILKRGEGGVVPARRPKRSRRG